jgi:tetratricopeptide (TPR) repeat protein
MGGCISVDRIISKLDGYLDKNDYTSAERHILYWLSEAEAGQDFRTELLMRNELMGLYRKLGKREEALSAADAALKKIEALGIGHQVGAATTMLNAATVYKAFGMAEHSLSVFERARAVYEKELDFGDDRLGGLYNNMGLTLVDLGRYAEARELYSKAIEIMQKTGEGDLEVAITYLNLASAAEAERGLVESDEMIQEYIEKAKAILEAHQKRDGYYAFVCEKCASVFGYYGHFLYEAELCERAKKIYAGV